MPRSGAPCRSNHYAGADTATFLGAAGKDVTIVTEQQEFGAAVEVIHMYVLRNLSAAVKKGALFGHSLDDQLRFNANNAIMNDLLLDGRIQLGG